MTPPWSLLGDFHRNGVVAFHLSQTGRAPARISSMRRGSDRLDVESRKGTARRDQTQARITRGAGQGECEQGFQHHAAASRLEWFDFEETHRMRCKGVTEKKSPSVRLVRRVSVIEN